MGVHPPAVHRAVPEPHFGFYPVGLPGFDFQSRARLITGDAASDFNINQEMASVEKKSSEPDRIAANM